MQFLKKFDFSATNYMAIIINHSPSFPILTKTTFNNFSMQSYDDINWLTLCETYFAVMENIVILI